MKTRFVFVLVAMVLLCTMAGIATAADVTESINYQGKLTDSSGNPLTGTYSITFKLYRAPSGGTALQTITQSVTCTNGIFNTNLPFSSGYITGEARWVGVQVGTDAEMIPRQELRPVPYALSLRPGAYIISNDGSAALSVHNSGGGSALSLITQYIGVPALDISTSTYAGSTGVNVNTAGENSNGAKIKTTGSNSDGIYVENTGSNSYGVNVSTTQFGSPGFFAATTGGSSQGLAAVTFGENSPAIDVATSGVNSHGVNIVTHGTGSYGVKVDTDDPGSAAFYAETTGVCSQGFAANIYGDDSPAIDVGANGAGGSYGVKAYSANSYGIYAYTGVGGGYGVYSPNYMNAKRYDTTATDVAEYMPVSENVTPGTVMIIADDGKLQESAAAYDTRVAGIVSTAPGVSLGTKDTGNPGEEQIAIGGRVPCKVDATKAPIHAGDLLTTSNIPGYAMKASDPKIGTVLGKAMGTLESGTGVIEVLVTLQ